MKIEISPQANPFYDLLNQWEHKLIINSKHLSESDSFFKKEVISRIYAIVSPIFFLLITTLKLFGGVWDLATSPFNQKRTVALIQSIGLSFACALLALPIGVIRPDLLARVPRTFFARLADPCKERNALAIHALAQMSDDEMDRNWQLPQFFGSIRVINLDRSPERLRAAKKRLEAIGVKENEWSRFRGCLGAHLPKETWSRMKTNPLRYDVNNKEEKEKLDKQHKGETGCYMSHYLVIKETAERYNAAINRLNQLENTPGTLLKEIDDAKAEVKKYSSVFIMEDDNSFERIIPPKSSPWQYESDQTVRKGNGRLFYEMMRDLPTDWDMLYLSSLNYRPPIETSSPRLLRLTRGVWLNAYAVNAKMYPKILKALEKIENSNEPLNPVDDEIDSLHPITHCFVTHPALATQGTDSVIHSNSSINPIRKQFQSHLRY